MITLLIIIIIDMINSGGNVVFTMIFVDMYTLFVCYIAYIYIYSGRDGIGRQISFYSLIFNCWMSSMRWFVGSLIFDGTVTVVLIAAVLRSLPLSSSSSS